MYPHTFLVSSAEGLRDLSSLWLLVSEVSEPREGSSCLLEGPLASVGELSFASLSESTTGSGPTSDTATPTAESSLSAFPITRTS